MTAILLVLAAGGCRRDRPQNALLAGFRDGNGPIADWLAYEAQIRPNWAAWVGLPVDSDRVDNFRLEAKNQELHKISEWMAESVRREAEGISGRAGSENALFRLSLAARQVELEVLRPNERFPFVPLATVQGLFGEFIQDAAPDPARSFRSLTNRLRLVRPLLEDARDLYRANPGLVSDWAVRHAVDLSEMTQNFFLETLPKLAPISDASQAEEWKLAWTDARTAIDDYQAFLQKELLAKARAEGMLGDAFLTWLQKTEVDDQPIELLVAWGQDWVTTIHDRLAETQNRLAPGHSTADVIHGLEEEQFKAEDILPTAQTTTNTITDFIKAKAIWPLSDPDRPRVLPMPPGMWGFVQLAVKDIGARDWAPALYVESIGRRWPERRKQEFLRTLHRAQLSRSVLHEAAGHFSGCGIVHRASSPLRRAMRLPSWDEGWALYAEEQVLRQGVFAEADKIHFLFDRALLFAAVRFVASLRWHVLKHKADDIQKLFGDTLQLDEGPARREFEHVVVDPWAGLAFYDYARLYELAADWSVLHPQQTRRNFHQLIFREGPLPVGYLRRVLLDATAR